MNLERLQKLLDKCYEPVEHKQDWFKIELLEALLEEPYYEDLGKTNFSENN